MKRVYNKETRRPNDDVYYRVGDWGVDVEDDFDDNNFTEVIPPSDSINLGVPCDWNETTGEWDIDTTAQAHTKAVNKLDETDIPLVRVLEDLIDVLIDKGTISMSDLPQAAQNKLNTRSDARDDL